MKIHEKREEVVVACCDEDLLGEKIEEEGISLSVNEGFYGSESFGREEVAEAMNKASICNLIGENCVELGIEEGIIDEENVLVIDDVPHAQMVTYLGLK